MSGIHFLALVLILAACATRDGPEVESEPYLHEPTGLLFPLYLGELVRDHPTTENPYVPGSIGVGYHHHGEPSLFVTLMPVESASDSDPTSFLMALLYVEQLRGTDHSILDSGTVDARCDDQVTPFSFIVTAGPAGSEARFSARFRGHLVYLRGLHYSSRKLVSPLLAGVLLNLGFPCTVAAT